MNTLSMTTHQSAIQMRKVKGTNFNWAKPSAPVIDVLFEVKDLPTYMGCVDSSYLYKDDYYADLQFGVCPFTGTIQSMNRLPSDKIYIQPHNACVGQLWTNHLEAFVSFIIENLPPNSKVCEIGGGDGSLARRCIDKVLEWHIIDPNTPPSRFEHSKLVYHDGYYPEVFVEDADVVIHSHLIEHIRDPREFFSRISAPLQLFSVPYFEYNMSHGNPNSLNFEHENALTIPVIHSLLKSCGYTFSFNSYLNFSSFYKAEKISSIRKITKLCDTQKSTKLLSLYKSKLMEHAEALDSQSRHKQGDYYFFGAHIFYTMLRSLGLNTKFVALLDNSPLKIGKRLYGTDLNVFSPKHIENKRNVVVVVPHTLFQNEMIEQIKLLNNSAQIVSWSTQ